MSSAPLKPFQKLDLLLTYLLPRFLYILQLPCMAAVFLSRADKCIRRFVKKALHISLQTPNAALHADRRGVVWKCPDFPLGFPLSFFHASGGWLPGRTGRSVRLWELGTVGASWSALSVPRLFMGLVLNSEATGDRDWMGAILALVFLRTAIALLCRHGFGALLHTSLVPITLRLPA